jgi:hypothetical protein
MGELGKWPKKVALGKLAFIFLNLGKRSQNKILLEYILDSK